MQLKMCESKKIVVCSVGEVAEVILWTPKCASKICSLHISDDVWIYLYCIAELE